MEFLTWLESLSFSSWVRDSSSIWAFPMFLFIHTTCMGIVAGGCAVIDLRLLGIPPKMPIKPLERMYPAIWAGFWINAVTGTVLMIADATTKLTNWDFYLKMAFVFTGVWIFHMMRKRVFASPEVEKGIVPPGSKGLAWISLACWFAAIVAGRLLAYLGPVTGLPGQTNR